MIEPTSNNSNSNIQGHQNIEPLEICSRKLTPFVYWAQDREHIYLRVEIGYAKDIDVRITNGGKCIEFSAISSASSGQFDQSVYYVFSLSLYGQVEDLCGIPRRLDNRIEIKLNKRKKWQEKFWQTLVAGKSPKWLKFDFERWVDDPDEVSANEGDTESKHGSNKKLEELMRELELEKDENGRRYEDMLESIKLMEKTYLFTYNAGMWLAHLYVLLCLLYGCVSSSSEYLNEFWSRNFYPMLACTLFQYLDVVNSLCGITNAGYKSALMQITGRLVILVLVHNNPKCSNWAPSLALMIVYCLSEQVRYPYYALNSLETNNEVGMLCLTKLLYLRYTVWMLLYPLGFINEGLILINSASYFYGTRKWSLDLPNMLNFSINFGAFLFFFTLTVFPFIMYSLVIHMWSQRKKKLADIAKTGRENSRKLRRDRNEQSEKRSSAEGILTNIKKF